MVKLTWIDEINHEKVVFEGNTLNKRRDWKVFTVNMNKKEFDNFLSEIPEGSITSTQLKYIEERLNER